MAKRQIFFSFHYDNDNWRAGQVRNMGKVDSSSTFSDNDWEEVKEKTANRKWINYEIKKAYELNKGIVGIYIHKLENSLGEQDDKGNNPFDYLTLEGEKLSKYVKCFDSSYSLSKYVYSDIKDNIEDLIEYGIEHKPSTW